MLEETLLNIGLTKAEARVYLALLELGKSSTGKIVEQAQVSSSKIYELLEKLASKGLVTYIIEKNVKQYEAVEPQKIIEYLKDKQKALEEQVVAVNKVLPELKLKKEMSKYISDAKIYKGYKGMQTAFNEAIGLLSKGDEFLAYGIPPRSDVENRFFSQMNSNLNERGIKARLIFNESAKGDLSVNVFSKLHQIRFMEESTPAGINITKNRTLIFPITTGDPIIFAIDNKDVADSFRAQFESLWSRKTTAEHGWPALQRVFDELHTSGDSSYKVLGAALGNAKNQKAYDAFFERVGADRMSKQITANLLFNQSSKKYVESSNKRYQKFAEIKYLPYESSIPVEVYPCKDKAYIVIQDEEPEVITINNSQVSAAFEQQFSALWNQDTQIYKGTEAIGKMFDELIDICGSKHEYVTYGAHYGDNDVAIVDAFKKGTAKRLAANVRARILFYGDQRELAEKHHDVGGKLTQIRYLDQTTNVPAEFIAAQNVVFINVLATEPVIIRIENNKFADYIHSTFELAWNNSEKRNTKLI